MSRFQAHALLWALCLAVCFSAPSMAQGSAAFGEEIYRQGISPSGAAITARVASGLEVPASQFPCASCHRRSGFGSSEGGMLVPPVTGPTLFRPTRLHRADNFRDLYQELQPKSFAARVRSPHARPAYDAVSLAAALREGHDPTGRPLDLLMPRYSLEQEDQAHLLAYLRTLGAQNSPGVDASILHFSTILLPDAAPEQRQDLVEMLETYVRWKNTDTQNLLAHPDSSPYHRDDFKPSYRQWKLHLWELVGKPQTWPEQLTTLYQKQPVFAVLSGLGSPWLPIHRFCDEREVPCLFPHTKHPSLDSPNDYNLYFNRGDALEVEVLANYLLEISKEQRRKILIVQGPAVEGSLDLSTRLQSELNQGGLETPQEILRVSPTELHAALEETHPSDPKILIWWNSEVTSSDLGESLADFSDRVSHLFLPSPHLKQSTDLVPSLRERTFFTWPYTLPTKNIPRRYRIHAWMRSRGLPFQDEEIQLGTYFALTVADHALHHLVENFSRDFFIEAVEHEVENRLNPGIYPRLSLGPGQRFASKGAYVVRRKPDAPGEIEPVSEWIVP